MAKFIKLTDKFGFPRLVNVDHIVEVHDVEDLNQTRVYLSIKIEANSHYIKVKETPEQIVALINGQ